MAINECSMNYWWAKIVLNCTSFGTSVWNSYDISTCFGKPWSHKFQTLVPKLVQFTNILLILGTMNNIFSTYKWTVHQKKHDPSTC